MTYRSTKRRLDRVARKTGYRRKDAKYEAATERLLSRYVMFDINETWRVSARKKMANDTREQEIEDLETVRQYEIKKFGQASGMFALYYQLGARCYAESLAADGLFLDLEEWRIGNYIACSWPQDMHIRSWVDRLRGSVSEFACIDVARAFEGFVRDANAYKYPPVDILTFLNHPRLMDANRWKLPKLHFEHGQLRRVEWFFDPRKESTLFSASEKPVEFHDGMPKLDPLEYPLLSAAWKLNKKSS